MLRFGPFALDPERGDLTKEGRPVRLQPQPTRLLTLRTTTSPPDGERVLMVVTEPVPEPQHQIHIVLDWLNELEEKLRAR